MWPSASPHCVHWCCCRTACAGSVSVSSWSADFFSKTTAWRGSTLRSCLDGMPPMSQLLIRVAHDLDDPQRVQALNALAPAARQGVELPLAVLAEIAHNQDGPHRLLVIEAL